VKKKKTLAQEKNIAPTKSYVKKNCGSEECIIPIGVSQSIPYFVGVVVVVIVWYLDL